MKLEKLHEILFILNVVLVQIAVKPVASNLSYENKDFVKIKQDPTRFQHASAYRNKKHLFATRHLNVTTPREKNDIFTYLTARLAPKGVSRNYSQEKNNIVHKNDKTVPHPDQFKKWQVGRVSRKQYEIINMLWRKTKIFVNLDQTTPDHRLNRGNETAKVIVNRQVDGGHALRKQAKPRFPSRLNLPSTTSSYIEFYYLDETDERGKDHTTQKSTLSKNREHPLRNGKSNFVLADSPMFAFRIHDPNYKRPSNRYMQPTNRMRRGKSRVYDTSLTGFDSLNSLTPSFPRQRTQQNKITTTAKINLKENIPLNVSENIYKSEYKLSDHNISSSKHTTDAQNIFSNKYTSSSLNISTSEYTFDNETCPITTEGLTTYFNDTSESEYFSSHSINVTHVTRPTTIYDKIKFFEMYDKNTPVPYYDDKGKLKDIDNINIFARRNDINNERQILLEHVDQSIGNEHSDHKAKHSKKHIIDNYKKIPDGHGNANSVDKKVMVKPVILNVSSNVINGTKQPVNKLWLPVSKVTNLYPFKKSKVAQWSEYSFAAVYIYEPSRVHCDAAAISFHWLVTSASCLSRHHKNPGGEGRSAFVTYCGQSWWNPERVAYVKYSLVHPRFLPRDRIRRHLYNIGLVQVVTSMASACYSWQPISLMSHQYIANVEGSIATAVGWGLDRFDTRYSADDLPKSPLMTYESHIFSDSCPGNTLYRKAKLLNELGIENVYCLSLPPYSGEETDQVHGGILLVGGKLVALYLQEERRPWGRQSAQYTGTWRLVPWVLDVARENDEGDSFTLDI